jgi:hypothetical protein
MDKTINENILTFQLTNDYLKSTTSTDELAFEVTNDNFKFTNETEFSFELKSYDAFMPTYRIVLDFIYETGGVY